MQTISALSFFAFYLHVDVVPCFEAAYNYGKSGSKTVLRQLSDGLLDKLCDIAPVGSNHSLFFKPVMEIHILGFRDGVLEIVVVI